MTSSFRILSLAAPLMLGAACLSVGVNASRAAEASAPNLASVIGPLLNGSEQQRVESRLRREEFFIVGEARRKGQFLVVMAVQRSVPWRLVIDASTGEIVGRRPMLESISAEK